MLIDKFLELYEKLPESTDYVTCRWFQVILLSCIIAVAAGVISWPSALGVVAIAVGCSFGGFVVGMRRGNPTGGTSCRA